MVSRLQRFLLVSVILVFSVSHPALEGHILDRINIYMGCVIMPWIAEPVG